VTGLGTSDPGLATPMYWMEDPQHAVLVSWSTRLRTAQEDHPRLVDEPRNRGVPDMTGRIDVVKAQLQGLDLLVGKRHALRLPAARYAPGHLGSCVRKTPQARFTAK
jgi:hypothetical protein